MAAESKGGGVTNWQAKKVRSGNVAAAIQTAASPSAARTFCNTARYACTNWAGTSVDVLTVANAAMGKGM